MKAIDVKNLSFSYGGAPLLDGVSFSLEAGGSAVVTGPSGCGKTTLFFCLAGIIPNAVRGSLSGEIAILGESLAGRPLCDAARRVGYVFQDPDDQLICTTVEDELAFGPENLCVEPSGIRRRVEAALDFFGLTRFRERDPATLSGGQKKLVAIASVLTLGPDVILLDEPAAGLDDDSRALVVSAAKSLISSGKTVLAIEHELSPAPWSGRILRLEGGKLHDMP